MPTNSPTADDPRLSLPAEWLPGLAALRTLPDGGAALLVGATDRGKTTFTALAAQTLAAEFGPQTIAVVDADIGQSEIGPPGTVGVAWADAEAARLHELTPVARFFVGAFTPIGVALEHAVATGQAVAFARAAGARRVLVDTTGFVAGPAARRLKVAKAALVGPSLIVGIGRDGELDGLLRVLGATTGARVLTLPVPEAVGRKSQTLRATRRMTRLSKMLDGAREIVLPLDAIATLGATLGTGAPVAPHLVRWAGTALRLPNAIYGELVPGALTLFVAGPAPRPGWENGTGPVAEHFGVRAVRVLSLAAHAGLLLGLHDERGQLLTLARFLRLDAERAALVVSAPPPASAERVRLVTFGRIRVNEDGSGGSEVKPGEV